MTALLDSNIIFRRLIPLDGATAVSAITLAEAADIVRAAVAAGDAAKAVQRAEDLSLLRAAYGPGLPFTGEMAESSARVRAALRRAGVTRRKQDYLIAATALHHGMDLLTTDTDFTPMQSLMKVTVVPRPPDDLRGSR